MPGKGFTWLAALSLLLCVFTGILWQRSFLACDVLFGGRASASRFTCTSEFGMLVFEYESKQQGIILPGWSYFVSPLPRRFRISGDLLGFAVYGGTAKHYHLLPVTMLRGLTIPHWFVFSLAAVLPALWLVRYRRRRTAQWRLEHGLCPRCSYDLRASAGQCPECGTLIAK